MYKKSGFAGLLSLLKLLHPAFSLAWMGCGGLCAAAAAFACLQRALAGSGSQAMVCCPLPWRSPFSMPWPATGLSGLWTKLHHGCDGHCTSRDGVPVFPLNLCGCLQSACQSCWFCSQLFRSVCAAQPPPPSTIPRTRAGPQPAGSVHREVIPYSHAWWKPAMLDIPFSL